MFIVTEYAALNWRLYSLWVLEMTITYVFCGLKTVNHLLAQMLNLLRSSFKTLSNPAKSAEGKLREVSSAKGLGLILMAIIKIP